MGQNYKGEKRELRIRSEKRTSRPEWWLDKAATGTEEDLEAPFSETVATGIKSSRSRSLSLVLISVLVFFFSLSTLILGSHFGSFFTFYSLLASINELFGTSNWFSFQFGEWTRKMSNPRLDPEKIRIRPGWNSIFNSILCGFKSLKV